MTHPSSLDLEAFACGEVSGPAAKVQDHLTVCAACSAFVDQLGGLVGPSAAEADALIARAMPVVAIGEARKRKNKKTQKSRVWLWGSSVVAPLAAAAAIVLLARSTPRTSSPSSSPTPSPTTTTSMTTPTFGEPDTTFKGGMQLAVVRERAGEQARFAADVRVRPGDRLRVEVALDREQAIVGAVIADDGSYLELMPLAVRGPGTHFSEKSAKIDGSPTYGTVIIGSPEAVARARATRRLEGVVSLRVQWEGTP